MTVNYVYLGYGTTDENGECKLDHDANGDSISHSYTGTGAGKIDVVASLDSPSSISDSSLVSETYEVLDCIFYDTGIDGTRNTDWWNVQGVMQISPQSDGTLLSNPTTNNGILYANIGSKGTYTDAYDFEPPFILETDIVSISGTGYIYVYDGVNANGLLPWAGLGLTGNNHLKAIISSNKIEWYVDNVLKYTSSGTFNKCGVAFRCNQNSSIKYKEFKIYPI